MGELDHLNEVLMKINENFKDLNASLLKSLNGEYFLKVKNWIQILNKLEFNISCNDPWFRQQRDVNLLTKK